MNKIIMVLMSVWVTHILAVTPKDTVTINGVKATVRASSELSSKTPGRYAVKNLFDNDPATALGLKELPVMVMVLEGGGEESSIYKENLVHSYLTYPVIEFSGSNISAYEVLFTAFEGSVSDMIILNHNS